jgi:membrane protease YdiL (CAAX protease family)
MELAEGTGPRLTSDVLMPVAAKVYSDRQRIFILYFTGALIDLVVLGLFDEYSDKVFVDSFTTMVLASVLLQLLLKATIAVEHRVAHYWKARPKSGFNTFMRFFCAWLVLFGSKFVILEALSFAFSDKVKFEGVFHGIVWLIVVVVTMVIAEELVARFYRRLADPA